MDAAQPSYPPSTPPATRQPVRPRNGLGVAALVIGVSSLVAAVSFLLFPLALIGGIVGAILGAIGIARANAGRANNQGQAAAGLACSVIALLLAAVLAVRVGTWVTHNTGQLGRLDKCLTKASGRASVADCFAKFAKEVR
jgi:hypothetical protein